MQLFLSTPLVCHYVSFHTVAEHSHLTIRNFLSCAKRVLRWWQTQAGGKHPSLVKGLQWLQTLNEQVADQLPRLVHIIDTAWKSAEPELQQEGVTVQTSRQLHDAALASLFCDTKRQETHPMQPCRRLRGCCLLSGSIVLLGFGPAQLSIPSFAPVSGLQQQSWSSLGLLSSAGCGSLLVNGAAQAKKKQKTAMMIKKTLFKEVSTVLLAFLPNSTTVPALVVTADAINQPAAREAVSSTIAQAYPGRLSSRPVWTVQAQGRSEATVK
ncbi:TPA: hypothetical protein ACH3X3_011736 [Trebouxia sp. C0006]